MNTQVTANGFYRAQLKVSRVVNRLDHEEVYEMRDLVVQASRLEDLKQLISNVTQVAI